MNLSMYEGKKITIITQDDIKYTGIGIDYTPADENTPEMDSICINEIEFYENDIKHIEILTTKNP